MYYFNMYFMIFGESFIFLKGYLRSLEICCKCIECFLSNLLYDFVINFLYMKMFFFYVLLVLRIIIIYGI